MKKKLYSFRKINPKILLKNSKILLYPDLKTEICKKSSCTFSQERTSPKKRNFRTLYKNFFFFLYSIRKEILTHIIKVFISLLKTESLAHLMKNTFFLYLLKRLFYIYLKTGISKTILSLPKTEISQNSLIYLF